MREYIGKNGRRAVAAKWTGDNVDEIILLTRDFNGDVLIGNKQLRDAEIIVATGGRDFRLKDNVVLRYNEPENIGRTLVVLIGQYLVVGQGKYFVADNMDDFKLAEEELPQRQVRGFARNEGKSYIMELEKKVKQLEGYAERLEIERDKAKENATNFGKKLTHLQRENADLSQRIYSQNSEILKQKALAAGTTEMVQTASSYFENWHKCLMELNYLYAKLDDAMEEIERLKDIRSEPSGDGQPAVNEGCDERIKEDS